MSRPLSALIKSSPNAQTLQDNFLEKGVSSGRSNYPSLISLIKSIPGTKEESLRREFEAVR